MTAAVRPIRLAVDEDIASIIALRAEAEDWLRRRGIEQWTGDYHDIARDILRAAVAAGTAWVVEDADQIVATVSFQPADPDFWDPPDDLAAALYPAKLIVARSHAGQHLGAAVMDWASRRAQAAGKRWLRIDVRRDNHQLHQYYLDQGWEWVRTVYPPRRRTQSGALFQRPAGMVTASEDVVVEEPGGGTAAAGLDGQVSRGTCL